MKTRTSRNPGENSGENKAAALPSTNLSSTKKTEVKICGLRHPADMQLCAALGVRWAGLIFHPASPRFLTLEEAQRLHDSVPTAQEGGMERVGLFVKPEPRDIAHILQHVPLDVLQLYTTPEKAREIRARFGLPVWLARGIAHTSDLPSPKDTSLDGFVIEARASASDTRPGGLGKRFDWSLTKNWPAPRPWLLAGGLTPENVQEALQTSGAQAVDVSSGTESAPGVKCAEKIRKFVKNAQSGACAPKRF